MAKIINFHDIDDEKWFSDTIEVIQEQYEIVPFSEIRKFYRGEIKSKNIAHITVDDGHISTYTIIYPQLKKLGLSASIFVSPLITTQETNFWYYECGDYNGDQLKECIAETIGVNPEKLKHFYVRSIMKNLTLAQNWEIIRKYQHKYKIPSKPGAYIKKKQLVELEDSGVFDIGAHTLNHPILANETRAVSKYEISQSIFQLSEILGRKITTFAYPNGGKNLDFGSREMSFLKECGIEYGFSFEFRNLSQRDNPYAIPRYGLHHGDTNFIRKKLRYGSYWEPIKKIFFNNEEKHRKTIQKFLGNRQHNIESSK